MNAIFAYDDAVAERYPTIGAGLVRATGLDNGLSSSELFDEYRAEQRAVSERLKATAITDLSSIAMAPGPCPVRRQPTSTAARPKRCSEDWPSMATCPPSARSSTSATSS